MNRTTDKASVQALADRAIKAHCTGDPNNCGKSYSVPTAPEEPICGILGGVCDRGATRDALFGKKRA